MQIPYQDWMRDFGKWGSFWTMINNLKQKPMKFLNFRQNAHENEIILAKRGVRTTPLNPLWIRPCPINYFKNLHNLNQLNWFSAPIFLVKNTFMDSVEN